MTVRTRRPRPSLLERDLTRLADGTLEPRRREPLERLLARSPELQRRLSDQRRAVAATRYVAQRERAPLAVRMRRRALEPPTRPRRRGLTLGLAGTLAALASVLAFAGGGAPGLTAARAATLATRPALDSVGEPAGGAVTLPGLRAEGLPFPYWEDRFGWRATGTRTDRIGGRAATTVFYRHGAEQIAYTIVSGPPLAPGAGTTAITAAGRHVVSWPRRGHTCVLSGRGVPLRALIELASWGGR